MAPKNHETSLFLICVLGDKFMYNVNKTKKYKVVSIQGKCCCFGKLMIIKFTSMSKMHVCTRSKKRVTVVPGS